MRPLNIAHRGGAGLRPENTLAAFENAMALKCDGAELDVQLTRDGKLAVVHDFLLDEKLVRDFTAAELPSHIPFLEDVIALARPHTDFRLFIEIKSSLEEPPLSAPGTEIAKAVVQLLRKKNFLHRTTLVSFDWQALGAAKAMAPGLVCWFSTGEHVQMPPRTLAAVILANAGQGWFPHHSRIDAAGVAAMHEAGLAIGAWTVDDEETMRKMTAFGVDAICTDCPDRLKKL